MGRASITTSRGGAGGFGFGIITSSEKTALSMTRGGTGCCWRTDSISGGGIGIGMAGWSGIGGMGKLGCSIPSCALIQSCSKSSVSSKDIALVWGGELMGGGCCPGMNGSGGREGVIVAGGDGVGIWVF